MLTIWRSKNSDAGKLFLDETPTGSEEEANLFQAPVEDPSDLNPVIKRERLQDMSERIFYADRAFLVTLIWVSFLVVMTFSQMLLSIYDHGLSDIQFVTVVTTTTASVFGFWLLVGNYLHRNKGPSAKASEPNTTPKSTSDQ